jgi:endoglucanase
MTNDNTFDADAQNTESSRQRSTPTPTRRSVLRGTGVAAAGLALGSPLIGTAAARDIPLPKLERDGNHLVDPCGQKVILRGTNIVDPCRAMRKWRNATAQEMFQMATNDEWANHIIRIPMQPQDISGAPERDSSNTSYMDHGDNWGPILPGAFNQQELDTYLRRFVDPLVEMGKQSGTYVQLDYHRHFPIFHQAQYEDQLGQWNNCNSQSFPADIGMCGERGVLWHGADQVSEIEGLTGTTDNAWYENHAEEVDAELTLFWETVANRYAGKNHVLFDIWNEPTGPYAGDWGSPERAPGGGDETGINTDVLSENCFPYWRLWLERAAPWVKIVEENAPGSVKTIGSPRWSQYTYWAKDMEIQDVGSTYSGITNMCYTGHRYTHENMQPMSKYYGTAAEKVPMFFNEFGWVKDGGPSHFPFLTGITGEGSGVPANKQNQGPEYTQFFNNYDVHPISWCFDHQWSPAFFEGKNFNQLRPYNEAPGRWWKDFVAQRVDQDIPSSGENCSDTGDTEPPAMPTNLTVTNKTTSSLTISWSHSGAGVDHYQVEIDGMRTMVTGTETTVSGLSSGTRYEISVRAVDAAGNMSDAISITASTKSTNGGGPPTGDAPTISVNTEAVTTGGMAKSSIILSDAPNGLSGYEIKVSVADTSVATIENAGISSSLSAIGTPTDISSDGSTVTMKAVDLQQNVQSGVSDVKLGWVSFKGQSQGETEVAVAVQAIDDDNGNDIPVQTMMATLSVISGSSVDPINGTMPTNIDDDPVYEDLNGNGELDFNDIVVYFNNMNSSAMTDHTDAYDFNGNGQIDFDDVVSIFEETA